MKVVVSDWLEASTVRWPDADDGPWEVTLTWRAASGAPVCVGFAVMPLDPTSTEPVSASLLRKMPVASLISGARWARWQAAGGDLVEAVDDGQDLDVSVGLVESLRYHSGLWAPLPVGRPKDLDAQHYAAVATLYSLTIAAGGNPLQAVVSKWTVSRPTASRWVARARKDGLLPPTQRGRAAGNKPGPVNPS